ncbi:hypothetical protein A3J19_03850 [Candidatus Daviesbacteria bacterium RIFCSPLOWO2_02_FULL_41_8]|uniref:DUF5615 domain-containing protein n=3 Tax=Candidatus Daviesiibacteriota TaxID=1752718 RepID=A0A1F5NLV5_9BACT|nr:MAG: hypothetical protein A2871_04130 [Candidatus Daviesbacteria bacterium RIFCSPHIGHO2_01_FULL_41_23]OGE33201.1 MAG: hypothetical protein A3D83_04225 [Candidatus Daviesbacteria bacterium RIFCSPHIGHO2_02_FULL_41_10]OGE62272.1 MAG: hypothetical protein A2967_02340 [Candidatus Daviesbacteria bacterium RIFCSPLOWO2_01_FULL_41_32]OGE78370.1 MAG: hypothetical protein A3J19_03850 [Candidatus Daviesbacteria bacterium RIFCSPLOWO2_02_FULL_41_8]
MKLLADENFPPTLVSYLQKKHHDVKRIQRSAKTISDISIKKLAIQENRIIFTFDKDFLKTEKSKKLFSAVVFGFPYLEPTAILVYMDQAIKSISRLKKQKRHFTATYSTIGLKLLD